MVCEVDHYLAKALERFASGAAGDMSEIRQELAIWDSFASGDFLAGELSAVDLSVYPFIALFLRIAGRRFVKSDFIGPRLAAWTDKMQALPIVQRTWPPHWK